VSEKGVRGPKNDSPRDTRESSLNVWKREPKNVVGGGTRGSGCPGRVFKGRKTTPLVKEGVVVKNMERGIEKRRQIPNRYQMSILSPNECAVMKPEGGGAAQCPRWRSKVTLLVTARRMFFK
jgi:hypothetical protein